MSDTDKPKGSQKRILIISVVAAVLVVGIIAVVALFFKNKGSASSGLPALASVNYKHYSVNPERADALKTAYQSVLDDAGNAFGEEVSPEKTSYTLVDVDNDGDPELVVMAHVSDSEMVVRVFLASFDNKDAVKAYPIGKAQRIEATPDADVHVAEADGGAVISTDSSSYLVSSDNTITASDVNAADSDEQVELLPTDDSSALDALKDNADSSVNVPAGSSLYDLYKAQLAALDSLNLGVGTNVAPTYSYTLQDMNNDAIPELIVHSAVQMSEYDTLGNIYVIYYDKEANALKIASQTLPSNFVADGGSQSSVSRSAHIFDYGLYLQSSDHDLTMLMSQTQRVILHDGNVCAMDLFSPTSDYVKSAMSGVTDFNAESFVTDDLEPLQFSSLDDLSTLDTAHAVRTATDTKLAESISYTSLFGADAMGTANVPDFIGDALPKIQQKSEDIGQLILKGTITTNDMGYILELTSPQELSITTTDNGAVPVGSAKVTISKVFIGPAFHETLSSITSTLDPEKLRLAKEVTVLVPSLSLFVGLQDDPDPLPTATRITILDATY